MSELNLFYFLRLQGSRKRKLRLSDLHFKRLSPKVPVLPDESPVRVFHERELVSSMSRTDPVSDVVPTLKSGWVVSVGAHFHPRTALSHVCTSLQKWRWGSDSPKSDGQDIVLREVLYVKSVTFHTYS